MYIKRFVKHYYIMLVPAFLWLFFFSIVPMFGVTLRGLSAETKKLMRNIITLHMVMHLTT